MEGDAPRRPSEVSGYTFHIGELVKAGSSACRGVPEQGHTALPPVVLETSTRRYTHRECRAPNARGLSSPLSVCEGVEVGSSGQGGTDLQYRPTKKSGKETRRHGRNPSHGDKSQPCIARLWSKGQYGGGFKNEQRMEEFGK